MFLCYEIIELCICCVFLLDFIWPIIVYIVLNVVFLVPTVSRSNTLLIVSMFMLLLLLDVGLFYYVYAVLKLV